jgi:hypothetical protein
MPKTYQHPYVACTSCQLSDYQRHAAVAETAKTSGNVAAATPVHTARMSLCYFLNVKI